MRATAHPVEQPRGVRDPSARSVVQTGGRIVYVLTIPGVYDHQPMFWVGRPVKFPGHVRRMTARPGTVITDIKWRSLNGRAWWRLPDWPDGSARNNIMSTSLPWNRPYAQWTPAQLNDGLRACDEFGWRNLARQIRSELRSRNLPSC